VFNIYLSTRSFSKLDAQGILSQDTFCNWSPRLRKDYPSSEAQIHTRFSKKKWLAKFFHLLFTCQTTIIFKAIYFSSTFLCSILNGTIKILLEIIKVIFPIPSNLLKIFFFQPILPLCAPHKYVRIWSHFHKCSEAVNLSTTQWRKLRKIEPG